MKIQFNRIKTIAFAFSLLLLLSPVSSYADSSLEKLCEAQYVESLKNAKQALVDQKREEALNFLLQATRIMESCARSPEKPDLKERADQSRLARHQANHRLSENALSEFHRSLLDRRVVLF